MKEKLNGILLVNKPSGLTSFDVVRKIRKFYNQKKIGHTGTLDPEVEGLMIISFGKATKLTEYLQQNFKKYNGEILLGTSTDTFDITGKILEEKDISEVDISDIKKNIRNFSGLIEQYPPIFSSVKVNGKKLYEYARNGESVKIPLKVIFIKEFKIISSKYLKKEKKQILEFEITSSKGSYMRSISNDFGKSLGIPSTMNKLKRLEADGYSLDDANDLDFIISDNFKIKDNIISIEDILSKVKKININDEMLFKVKNGQKIFIEEKENELLFFDNDNNLIALYEKYDNNNFKIKHMF